MCYSIGLACGITSFTEPKLFSVSSAKRFAQHGVTCFVVMHCALQLLPSFVEAVFFLLGR